VAEAPLSLLLGGGSPQLVAEDRPLLPGVRLRRLRLRPTVDASVSELVSGGPGRVRRLLAQPVVIERCELEVRIDAMGELMLRELRGRSIAGLRIATLDLEEFPGERGSFELSMTLHGDDGELAEWGARVELSERGDLLGIDARTLWASPSGLDPRLVWRALLVCLAGQRGITVGPRGGVRVDPLALWVDRWLVLGGHRPLRPRGESCLVLAEDSPGSFGVFIRESQAPMHRDAAEVSATVIKDAGQRLLDGIADGRGREVYEELAAEGGRRLPESAGWELAASGGELGPRCAALELVQSRGADRARLRLAMAYGRSGAQRRLVAMLERAWRIEPHPVRGARFRIAWALGTAAEADGVARARRELEGLVAEIGDGRWPSSVTGEAWAALAKLRVADPEVSAELVVAAALEASHHMSSARGGETLLEVALDLYERGAAADEPLALRARMTGAALVEEPDPALRDRLRHWASGPAPV